MAIEFKSPVFQDVTDTKILYHASRDGIKGKIVPMSRQNCDFGSGFYMGTEQDQPKKLVADAEQPLFYTLRLNLSNLRILELGETVEWAMVVAHSRGKLHENRYIKSRAYIEKYKNMLNSYDIICGPIADDKMFTMLDGFFRGLFTTEVLIHCMSVMRAGIQYVAKTQKACDQIEILNCVPVSKDEQIFYSDKSKRERAHYKEITENCMVRYRREGKFFDEILSEGGYKNE